MEQRLPAVPVVDLAEERLPNERAAVDRLDVEVVPLGPVDVEDDRLESERLGDCARDRVQDGTDVGAASHCPADCEQALQGRRELGGRDGAVRVVGFSLNFPICHRRRWPSTGTQTIGDKRRRHITRSGDPV